MLLRSLFLNCAFAAILLPGSVNAQSWIDISPRNNILLTNAEVIEFADGNFEFYVWGQGGWYLDATGEFHSMVTGTSVVCYLGRDEYGQDHYEAREKYLRDIARGPNAGDPVYSLLWGSECHWFEPAELIHRDALDGINEENEWYSRGSWTAFDAHIEVDPLDANLIVAYEDVIVWLNDDGIVRENPTPFDDFTNGNLGRVFSVKPQSEGFFISRITDNEDTLYRVKADGNVWEPVFTSPTVVDRSFTRKKFGCTDLTYLSGAPQRIVLATIDGIHVSDDDGATWTQTYAENSVFTLRADAVRPGRVYAGSFNGELLRSDDNGATWEIYNNAFSTFHILGIQPLPENDEVIVAARNGVFKVLSAETVVGVEEEIDTQGAIDLISLAPNPAYEQTSFVYHLRHATQAQAFVVDLLGRIVTTVSKGFYTAGRHSQRMDCSALPPGVYSLVLQTARERVAQRFVVGR